MAVMIHTKYFLRKMLHVWLAVCTLVFGSNTNAQSENSHWVNRIVSLHDLGFNQTITFNQKIRERHFYFPIAQNVALTDVFVDLDGVYLNQFAGVDGLTVSINGEPLKAQSLAQGRLPTFLKMTNLDGKAVMPNAEQGNPEIHLSIPLGNLDPSARFVDVGLSFNSITDAEHCTDIAGHGNELQLDMRSRLRYRYNQSSVGDVRSFLTTLPRQPQLLLPNVVTSAQYEGALRLLMGLHSLGLNPQLSRMPVIGDEVATTNLALPDNWSNLAIFHTLSIAHNQQQKFHISNDADVAAWLAVRIVSDVGLADILIGSVSLQATLLKVSELWREQGVLQLMPENVQQAVANKWSLLTKAGTSNLSLLDLAGTQVLMIDTPNQNPAAILPSSIWAGIANGSMLSVNQVGFLKLESSSHRLMIAQNSPVQYLQGMVHWEIPVSAKEWTNGERPNSLQLNVISAHRNGNTPAIISVFMNDYLLTAKDLRSDGEVTAVAAFVPLYALKTNNVLRIEVYDPMQKNCASAQSLPVQILPSSYIGLGGSSDVHEFFSLIPMLAHDSLVILPLNYLQHAEDSLLTVSRMLQGLGMGAGGFKIKLSADKEFIAYEPFVSFEVHPKNLVSLVDTHLDKLVMRDKNQAVIFDSAGLGSLALAQIIEGQGVLIERVGKKALNLQAPLEFSMGNIAVLDKQGVKLTLDTNDPQQEFSLNESGRGIQYFIERFHLPFVITAIILLIAAMLLLTRLALKEYHRRLNRRQNDQINKN